VHTVEVARTFSESSAGVASANVARLVKGGLARMANGSTPWGVAFAGWVSLVAAGLLACQTLKAWPDQAPASGPAAERPPPEDKPARTDRFGDPMPHGALARLGTVRWRHATGLFRMAFTRAGKELVTAGWGNPARLWDVATGRMLRPFGDGWDDRSLVVAFSPDGRIVAGGGAPRATWACGTRPRAGCSAG
jgi:hypothetical protein